MHLFCLLSMSDRGVLNVAYFACNSFRSQTESGERNFLRYDVISRAGDILAEVQNYSEGKKKKKFFNGYDTPAHYKLWQCDANTWAFFETWGRE